MDFFDTDWAAVFNESSAHADRAKAGSPEAREMWNKKAAGFARKPQRSDYVQQFIKLLALAPGETVLDMGCGSGTVAVPLACAGHNVYAVDFSPAMLSELQRAAEAAGVCVCASGSDPTLAGASACMTNAGAASVSSHADAMECDSTRESAAAGESVASACDAGKAAGAITTYERSWQEDWDGIPVADVALASRSLVTDDLADAVRKLEAHAHSRVAVTVGAGDLPYRDQRIFAAMGRADEAAMCPVQLASLFNFLLAAGRLPRVDYIMFPGVWQRSTRKELEEAVRSSHAPRNAREEQALAQFLDEHVVRNENKQRFELDYPREDKWAYLEWNVPKR